MANNKVGVYVDSMNIVRNGGYGMRYEVLRRFASRNGDEVVRLNAYVAIDEERASSDPNYKATLNFISTLRDLGFKVIEKPIRWFTDESGRTYGKANADMDMALDIISQSDRLDIVYLLTGDGDFCNVVTMIQNKGCRVELIAFSNVSATLRREADLFVSGYLIPGLSPTQPPQPGGPRWGEPGSRVRGVCTKYLPDKAYGFLRFMHSLGKLWVTDTRQGDSPYSSVFFMEKDLPAGIYPEDLPSRDHIFEFTLVEGEKGFIASDIILVYQYHS
ncbi:MAG: NYN domain-containing protein [Deltaproteobacteria bacterium]|nr:NYN domain-containing protein [Deltaproteobacteria bacterium]MBW1986669.1 NYN domain-containing protein [Deltaproteobacteria bacterium]MBW2134877.1 NYN domain-containing protein [Deltaproteobacteria bacterium]